MRHIIIGFALWIGLVGSAFGQEHVTSPAASHDELTPKPTSMAQDIETKSPHQILVGGYINDIQLVDLKTHSFLADIYIWFRWQNPDIDPMQTYEFMNLFDPEGHIEDVWYDEHEIFEGGIHYNVIRHQGAFSTKFPLTRYPFDKQELAIILEDAEYGSGDVVYIADPEGLTISADLKIPGYTLGTPELRVTDQPYPTRFGDLNAQPFEPYSRVSFVLPISRPVQSGVIKSLLPIMIIILCAGLSLLVHPRYTEGRIGLVITALLTLVALQITSNSDLPEVGYLMFIDQVYLLAYGFIFVILAEVVENTWRKDESEGRYERAIRRDRIALTLALVTFFALFFGLLINNLN